MGQTIAFSRLPLAHALFLGRDSRIGAFQHDRGNMLRLPKWAVLAVLVFVIAISILSRFAQARSDGRTDVFVLSAKSVKFLGMLPSRDSHCSLADVWTHGLDVESDAALKRVESSLRVLKLENGFDLIGTPRATFWIPHRDFGSLRDMIADQERDLYGAGSRGVHHGDIVLEAELTHQPQ